MADVLTTGRRTNGGDLVAPNPSGLPVRRRWGRIALGVAFVVVWTWGTVAAVMSAGDRVEVLAVARDVGRFEAIDNDDLKVVRVSASSDVDTVSAGQLQDLVGRRAKVDLLAGGLLSPSQLVNEGERVVRDSEALVGARLKPQELPADGVVPGADVLVVVRPAQSVGADSSPKDYEGWILSVGEADEATGERAISLVVPRAAASEVTAAAADGRVSVVVLDG